MAQTKMNVAMRDRPGALMNLTTADNLKSAYFFPADIFFFSLILN